MADTNFLSSSSSKRHFLLQLAGCGAIAFSSKVLGSSSQSASPQPNAVTAKPWLPIELTSERQSGVESAPNGAPGTVFWPGSGPALRLSHWTRTALGLIVKYQQNPLRASRTLAYLHIAMHDAWHHTRLNISTSHVVLNKDGLLENAAHEAAAQVLAHFYPNETPGTFTAMLAAIQASLPTATDSSGKPSAGNAVAAALIDRSLRDGAGRVWPIKQRPADFPGIWQATHPLYAVNPAEAYAASWRPWVPPAAARYEPPVAPRPGSARHAAETQQVLNMSTALSETQIDAAQRWNLESGSVTPAGVWVAIALDELKIGEQEPINSGQERAALFLQTLSTLCAAMHDGFIACWKIKFRDWSERPVTAIRRDADRNFTPLLVTPGFPAYVSGHATVSAAAAYVLAGQWPERHSKFQAMAQQAADSRLWGGIHFRSDNEEGLKLGEAVGRDVAVARSATSIVS